MRLLSKIKKFPFFKPNNLRVTSLIKKSKNFMSTSNYESNFETKNTLYSAKVRQNYLTAENNRRRFDYSTLKKLKFNLHNIINTGYSLDKMDCFEFPYEEPKHSNVNTVKNSFIRVIMPFEKSFELTEMFVRFDTNKVRIGKLLEIMDFLSGRVCYKHLQVLKEHNFSCVTACVDSFQVFHDDYRVTQSLSLNAYITYVGNRTIEVQCDLFDCKEVLQMTAKYLFVAKHNPLCHVTYKNNEVDVKALSSIEIMGKDNKSIIKRPMVKRIPKIDLENDEDPEKAQLLSLLGEENQKKRLELNRESTLVVPPKGEEIYQLHDILLEKDEFRSLRTTRIKDTMHEKLTLSHVADRNIHNTTFGGFLMRESFELAYITAYMQGKGERPTIYHINDTQFLSPVPYGSILKFKSCVCYAYKRLLNVKVTIDTYQKRLDGGSMEIRTNDFNVTFLMEENQGVILPETYKEAMLYIDGKRRIKKLYGK